MPSKLINLIFIKTCNNSYLLNRSLDYLVESAGKGNTQNYKICVFDDSYDPESLNENKAVVETFNMKKDISVKYYHRKNFIKILSNNNYGLDQKVNNLYFSDFDDISKGLGPNGSHNAILLLGLMYGSELGYKTNEIVISIHDDDTIYKYIDYVNEESSYKFFDYDYISKRLLKYENPKVVVSFGKYTGHSGSSISLIKQLLQFCILTLDSGNTIVPKHADSPFALLNDSDMTFKDLTFSELYESFNEIVSSFMQRTPQIGFKIASQYEVFDKMSINFDLGHFSVRGSFAKYCLLPSSFISEYYLTGVLRNMLINSKEQYDFRVEKPIAHLRYYRTKGGGAQEQMLADALASDPSIANHKVLMSMLRWDSDFVKGIENTLGMNVLEYKLFPDFTSYKQESLVLIKQHIASLLAYIDNSYFLPDYVQQVIKNGDILRDLLIEVNTKIVPSLERSLDKGVYTRENTMKSELYDFIKYFKYWTSLCDAFSH